MPRITPQPVADTQTYFFPDADGTHRPVSVEATSPDEAREKALAKLEALSAAEFVPAEPLPAPDAEPTSPEPEPEPEPAPTPAPEEAAPEAEN